TILTLLIFFFNYTSTTHIYTLSLHDALPISFEKQPCASRKKDSKHSSQERIGKEAWIRFRRRFLGTTPNTSKPRLAIGKSWEIFPPRFACCRSPRWPSASASFAPMWHWRFCV